MPGGLKNDADLVAFEFPEWTIKSFQWDVNDVPSWATKNKCVSVFREVRPIWVEYEKVEAAARTEYEKATAAAWAEYEKVTAPALAEYEKAKAAARTEMIGKLSTINGYLK